MPNKTRTATNFKHTYHWNSYIVVKLYGKIDANEYMMHKIFSQAYKTIENGNIKPE